MRDFAKARDDGRLKCPDLCADFSARELSDPICNVSLGRKLSHSGLDCDMDRFKRKCSGAHESRAFPEWHRSASLTFTTSAAGNYYGYADVDVNGAGADIVVKLTFSGTSFAAKISASVEKLI